MTSRSFKAKLIGSEILRSIKERADSKADFDPNNPELNKEKDKVIDTLQVRLVAVLEKVGGETDALIGGRKKEASTSRRAYEIYEIYGATNDALIAYRAAEVRYRAQESPFGGVLEEHLNALRPIKLDVDAEQSRCPCVVS